MAVQATKELLPLEGATSAVWKHFGFPSQDGKIVQEKKKRDSVHCKYTVQRVLTMKTCAENENVRFWPLKFVFGHEKFVLYP